MEILTGEQMRRVDRRAIDGMGMSGLDLMEAAGRGVAAAILRDHRPDADLGVLVFCGKGNNGGDGLVAARHLLRAGAMPAVVVLGRAEDLRGDAAAHLGAGRAAGLVVEEVVDAASWARLRPLLERPGVALDALLGTGVRGGARGLVAEVIEDLSRGRRVVISIDLPSGVDADTGAVEGAAVRAHRTYTLCRPKLALVAEPAASFAGSWSVIDIGIPPEAVAAEHSELEWLDADALSPLLPRRPHGSHKGNYGHLLAVCGSRGKAGAGVLVGRGALRAGVGLVTVATPRSSLPIVAAQQAEIMTEPLPETREGALAKVSAKPALELLASRDALALGPGLGTAPETVAAVHALLRRRGKPTVLDADGLNAVAPDRISTPILPAGGAPIVITPHPGEAARLLASSTAVVQTDRLAAARRLARETGAVAVLKGHRTVIANPDGRASFNSTGNPGMASAGSGDILTGVIGAFLARGMAAHDAARLGVFVHGDAGDRVARRIGEEGMIASDVLEELPGSLAALGSKEGPGSW